MKKLFLVLALLMGFGASLSFASQVGNELSPARTIPLKSGYAAGANTLIVAHGGVLRLLTGYASSSNATFVVYDASSVNAALGMPGFTAQQTPLIEGGQATQYNSLTTIDFGDVGINFVNGLVVITSTAAVNVLYY